jgi:hypothetical protein
MMKTGRYLALAVLLLSVAFLVWGRGKKAAQTTAPASPDNRSAVTQSAANGSSPNSPANDSAGLPDSGNASDSQQAPPEIVIPAGTPITVRLQEGLSSASAAPGERFDAVIDEPVVVDNEVVIPSGAPAVGHVVLARRSGRLRHPGELGLTLDSVTVGNEDIRLPTSSVVARGGSHKKRNWAFIGGGTGGGALIGALAAGGKGALIGSGIGAVAGTTTAFVTGKKNVAFGAERRLRFRLDRDISVSG